MTKLTILETSKHKVCDD